MSESTALAVSVGGVVYADAAALAPADNIRTMWVVVKQDGDWRIASYQQPDHRLNRPRPARGDGAPVRAG